MIEYDHPAGQPKKVNENLENLGAAITRLEGLYARLTGELAEVLAPDYDGPQVRSEPHEAPIHRLHTEIIRLVEVTNSLYNLADRIRL